MNKKRFIKPVYAEEYVEFDGTKVSIDEIRKMIYTDLYSFSEIAGLLSAKCGAVIGVSAIQKLMRHYGWVIDPETKYKKMLKRSEKTAKTLMKQYGVVNTFQLQATKDKAAKTKLERYGDAKFVNKELAKKTCLEKYGVENYSSTAACRESVRNTNIMRYGAKTPAESDEIKEKMKRTCLERYGVDNYWKADAFKAEQQRKYFAQYEQLTDEYKDAYHSREKLLDILKSMGKPAVSDVAERFHLCHESAYALLAKHDLLDYVNVKPEYSAYEREIATYIGQDLCLLNDREALNGKELDIYIPSKRLAIEFNGTYWHSSKFKTKKYHQDKSKAAEKAGIRLIHIYEYEWANPDTQRKIKLMLDIALGRVRRKLYARQCEARQISNAEAKVLNEAIHLQGHRNAQVTYGLYYNGELVQLMSFSRTKYNRNLRNDNDWEIIRGCPGSNNVVIGGVSRLLSHFISDYKPARIFSYCDYNKFNGISYEKAGFSFIGYTEPDMKWIMEDGSVVNRRPSKHAELKALAKWQIFGAGSKKYVLDLTKN